MLKFSKSSAYMFNLLPLFSENVTMRQLDLHQLPISLINPDGFWNSYLTFLDHLEQEKFIRPEDRNLVHVAETPADALDWLDQHAAVDSSGG